MGKKALYGIEQGANPGAFKCTKVEDDKMEVYHLSEVGDRRASIICTCFAGSKPTCRHRQMLRLFQAEDRVGKGWLYHFDNKQWYPPQNPEA